MKINSFNLSKLAAGVLFIIAWCTGQIHGILAWSILLLFIDIKWTRK